MIQLDTVVAGMQCCRSLPICEELLQPVAGEPLKRQRNPAGKLERTGVSLRSQHLVIPSGAKTSRSEVLAESRDLVFFSPGTVFATEKRAMVLLDDLRVDLNPRGRPILTCRAFCGRGPQHARFWRDGVADVRACPERSRKGGEHCNPESAKKNPAQAELGRATLNVR